MSRRGLGLGVDVIDLARIRNVLDRHETRVGGLFIDAIHLSISHERSYAVAVAILEGDPS